MNPQLSVFTARGSDILERKKGGGRLILLGLPFFLVGLFVAQIPFGVIPVELEARPLVMAILFPLGPLFAAVGLTLMLSRSGLTINRGTREVTHWWGLLIPMKKKKYNFDHFTKVRIEFREGDRNSPDTFPISLACDSSQSIFHITDLADYQIAMKAAEELAHFVDKPLENLTSDFQQMEPK